MWMEGRQGGAWEVLCSCHMQLSEFPTSDGAEELGRELGKKGRNQQRRLECKEGKSRKH